MLSQAQEELLHVSDVKGEVGVEDDDVIEVGRDVVEALDDLVDDLDTTLEQRCFLAALPATPRDAWVCRKQ